MKRKNFPLDKLSKLIAEYEPAMILQRVIDQTTYIEEIEDEMGLLSIKLGKISERFTDEILSLCGVPKDTTVKLGMEKGFCRDYWSGAVYDYWFGDATQEKLMEILLEAFYLYGGEDGN